MKIKEKSTELYKKVIDGSISIKNAYETAFPSKKDKQTPIQTSITVNYDYPKDEEPDFTKVLSMLKDLNEQLKNFRGKLKEDPSLSELKEIDTEVFKLRKNIG